MIAYRVDIMCLSHSKPRLVERRYYRHMRDVMALFEHFTPEHECPMHSSESLIPRFYGPCEISREVASGATEDSHVNVLRLG